MNDNKNKVINYFLDWAEEQGAEWIEDNMDELHHHAFNTDYYIIGRHRAAEWLGDGAFEAIQTIKDYEESNFGEVTTDFSEPEKVVNMYAYIIGEQIVADFVLIYKAELEPYDRTGFLNPEICKQLEASAYKFLN